VNALPELERDPLAVYLVVNGALGMSAGKIAAQSFQAAQRLLRQAEGDSELAGAIAEWEAEGTRTCTRLAKTQHVFDRLVAEVPGALMVDEGMTEVEPGSATCFASAPVRRSALPRMLRHKAIAVMRVPAEAAA
jgi:peptidyl-tRNA hydrolase